jgi:hypothetical protein
VTGGWVGLFQQTAWISRSRCHLQWVTLAWGPRVKARFVLSLSSELQPHVHNYSSLLQVSELRQKLQELDRQEEADMAALAAKYRSQTLKRRRSYPS